MTEETKNMSRGKISEADREFYIGSAVLAALSVAIALMVA